MEKNRGTTGFLSSTNSELLCYACVTIAPSSPPLVPRQPDTEQRLRRPSPTPGPLLDALPTPPEKASRHVPHLSSRILMNGRNPPPLLPFQTSFNTPPQPGGPSAAHASHAPPLPRAIHHIHHPSNRPPPIIGFSPCQRGWGTLPSTPSTHLLLCFSLRLWEAA